MDTEISGEMRIEYMALDEIIKWPRNPKKHKVHKIKASMSDFGYVAPIVIDEGTKRLVAGHGRLDALFILKGTGSEAPPRVRNDGGTWYVPVVRGVSFKSESDAERYLLTDNRITELGGWDNEILTDILSGLVEEEEELLNVTGFTVADYDRLIKDLNKDTSGLNDADLKHVDSKAQFEAKCPKCGHKFVATVKESRKWQE